MSQRCFFWVFLWLWAGPLWGQSTTAAVNPFELKARLAVLQAAGAGADTLSNPFDVVPHRVPGASAVLADNQTPEFRPLSVLPRGKGMTHHVMLSVLVVLLTFLAFSVAYNRTVVIKAWRGFLSDNALGMIQREAAGFTGSTPYYLLYTSFLLNAGVFTFLVIHFFRKDTFYNLGFLLLCVGGGGACFSL